MVSIISSKTRRPSTLAGPCSRSSSYSSCSRKSSSDSLSKPLSTFRLSQMTALRISVGVQSTGPTVQGRSHGGQLAGRGLVEQEGRVGMLLQEAGGDGVGDRPFDGPRTIGALCSPNAISTILRASRMVPTPIVRARCGTFSSPKKSLAASRRVTGSSVTRRVRLCRVRAGLVEADVAVAADAQDLQIDAAGPADRLFVAQAVVLDFRERHGAVGNVDVLRRDVDVVEESLVHPAVVAVQIVRLHGIVFVEVEGDDARQVEPLFAMQADQLAIQADRRAAGGSPSTVGRPAELFWRIRLSIMRATWRAAWLLVGKTSVGTLVWGT